MAETQERAVYKMRIILYWVSFAYLPHVPLLYFAYVGQSHPMRDEIHLSAGMGLLLLAPVSWLVSALLLDQNLNFISFGWFLKLRPVVESCTHGWTCFMAWFMGRSQPQSREEVPGFGILAVFAGGVMMMCLYFPELLFVGDIVLLTTVLARQGSFDRFHNSVGPRITVESYFRQHPELRKTYSLAGLRAALRSGSADPWAAADSLLKEMQSHVIEIEKQSPVEVATDPAAIRMKNLREQIAELDTRITNSQQAMQQAQANNENTTLLEIKLVELRHQRLALEEELNQMEPKYPVAPTRRSLMKLFLVYAALILAIAGICVAVAALMYGRSRRDDKAPPLARLALPILTTIDFVFDSRPIAFPLGWRPEDGQRPYIVSETHLSLHQLVLGTTGSGKSRYCEGQARFLIDMWAASKENDMSRGFFWMDADGDSAENLLVYAEKKAAEKGVDAIVKKIVYIELNYATVFGIDFFAPPDFSHIAPELQENAYLAWLPVRVDTFCEIVQSKQGASDFTGMARLQRILRLVITAVGVAINSEGHHLPLSEVFALLDCDDPRHEEVYAIVRDHLPDEIRVEFERLRGADRRQRLLETESTLNRLRSLLSPLVMAVFTEPARRINFRELIDKRMIVLVNLRQTDYLSADQQRAIGTMFIHEIWTACKTEKRESRTTVPYYLFVDEAHIYMQTAGGDLLSILERGRKYKISLTLISQYLGQFKNEQVDLIPAVLNLCRTFACFLHSNPDDIDILKRYFGFPNLDFTELLSVTDRPAEPKLIRLRSWSKNQTVGKNWTVGASTGKAESETESKTHAEGAVAGISVAIGEQNSVGNSSAKGGGSSEQKDAKGHKTGSSKNGSESKTESANHGKSRVEATTTSNSVTNSTGHSTGKTTNEGESVGMGGSTGEGYTESITESMQPQTWEDWHQVGKLRRAVEDQFNYVGHCISRLKDRQAFVKLYGEDRTFRMDVGDVPDVFADPVEMARAIEAFKEKIFRFHPFYFVPDLSPSAQRNRMEVFVEGVEAAREANPIDASKPDQKILRENPLD